MSSFENRRIILNGINPDADIDLGSIPSTIWELVLETTKIVPSLKLVNIPINLTLLDLGPNLSSSLTEPFHLPATLLHYRGPVLNEMNLPKNIKDVAFVETMKSIQSSKVKLPNTIRHLTIENPLKFSSLDEIRFPVDIESFRIIGKHSCSLERLEFPSNTMSVNLGDYTQPLDLINRPVETDAKLKSEGNSSGGQPRPIADKSSLIVKSGDQKSLDALRSVSNVANSKVAELRVILGDEVSTIGDVWTDILHEGRVSVGELAIVNGLNKPCLTDCVEVFERSWKLNRSLCKKLIVLGETFSYATHLNLVKSLKRSSALTLEIYYIKNKSITACVIPRLASIMGLTKSESMGQKKGSSKYVSDKFGARLTSIDISDNGSLVIKKGDSPMKFKRPIKHTPCKVPVSSVLHSELNIKPKKRPIVFHTWTQCGFCEKQEKIIEEFKSSSGANKNLFEDLVEVKQIENPADIVDERVNSFPTWVKNGELIIGVQNLEKIRELLNDSYHVQV